MVIGYTFDEKQKECIRTIGEGLKISKVDLDTGKNTPKTSIFISV